MELTKFNSSVISKPGCPVIEYINSNYQKLFNHKKNKGTRTTYQYNGKHFLRYLNSIECFDEVTLENYVRVVEEDICKTTTKAARCTAAKIMIERVNHFRSDLIPDAIYKRLVKDIDWIRSPNEVKRSGQNKEEIQTIKTAIDAIEDRKKHLEMKAQYALLGIQGFRASEAAKVKVQNINFNNKTISVVVKGGKSQIRRAYSSALEILREHIKYNGIERGYLFPYKETHITRNALSMKWKRFFEGLGMGVYTIHDFRHYIATTIAIETGDAYGIKNALGHGTIVTSQHYVDDEKNRQTHRVNEGIIGY